MPEPSYKHRKKLDFILIRILIIAFISFGLLTTSYSQKKQNYIILTGRIDNIERQTNGKKTIELNPPFYLKKTKSKTIELADDGSFKDTIRNGSGLYFIFDNNNMVPVYLNKSNKYSIKYDASKYRNKGYVQLNGADTSINRYFIEKSQNRIFVDRLNVARSEENFRKFINNKKQSELQRLEKSKLPKLLKLEEAKNINYEYLSELYYFLQVKAQNEPAFVSSEVSKKELAIDYTNDNEYKQQGYYSKLVNLYYDEKLNYLSKKNKKEDSLYSPLIYSQNLLRYYDSLVANEYIKNDLIEQCASFHLQKAKDKNAFYNDFKKYYTGKNEAFKEAIYQDYLRFSKLKAGTPSPEFYNYLNAGGGKKSLKDFRGKFIYIDIWATWCGNCWRELPYLKKWEKDYEGKNIIFLSLSWDRLESEWRDAIKKYNMGGIQLLANREDGFFKQFAVNGIPRYIFLDPEGRIIDYNAPMPSEKESLHSLFKNVGL